MEVDFQRATCPVFDSTVNCVRIQTFIIQYSPHPWSCLRKRQASENTFEFIFLLFKNCDYDDCVCVVCGACVLWCMRGDQRRNLWNQFSVPLHECQGLNSGH